MATEDEIAQLAAVRDELQTWNVLLATLSGDAASKELRKWRTVFNSSPTHANLAEYARALEQMNDSVLSDSRRTTITRLRHVVKQTMEEIFKAKAAPLVICILQRGIAQAKLESESHLAHEKEWAEHYCVPFMPSDTCRALEKNVRRLEDEVATLQNLRGNPPAIEGPLSRVRVSLPPFVPMALAEVD
ncbi:MAG: hypothetical protein V4555_16470 [Acidobacteriota bacterium]